MSEYHQLRRMYGGFCSFETVAGDDEERAWAGSAACLTFPLHHGSRVTIRMTMNTAVAMKVCLCLSLVALFDTAIAVVPFDGCPEEGDMVTRVGRAEGPLFDGEAPSPAPSAAMLCTSQTSNARGRYTSTLAPCVFTFHSVEEEEVALIDYQTSSLCSSENKFLVMKEYVYDWADECVGTFQRCYSLEHHQDVLFDFLCAMHGKFPEGTTHVSVDCTEDQELEAESENFS